MVNLTGIGIQVTATHTVSHSIEIEHKVPHTTSPLPKSFVSLHAPEPQRLPHCAVNMPLPVLAKLSVIFPQEYAAASITEYSLFKN